MIERTLLAFLLAVAAAPPSGAFAQSPQAPLQDRWPAPTQQLEQRTPAPAPTAPPAVAPSPMSPVTTPQEEPEAPAPAAAPKPKKPAGAATRRSEKPSQEKKKPPAQPGLSVACSGAFARNSNHLALAKAFNAKNVTFGEVEGGADGAKLMASVLYPDDPTRRLEVLWQNEETRSDTHRIVINGRSTWIGPKGLRLGLSLAAVEKINGKSFAIQGFDQNNVAVATNWQGGALAALPGGCIVGIFFNADPKASPSARAAASGAEFSSGDAAFRAVKPTVREILIGYPE